MRNPMMSWYNRVETDKYEAAHGHKPRGRGEWRFVFTSARPAS